MARAGTLEYPYWNVYCSPRTRYAQAAVVDSCIHQPSELASQKQHCLTYTHIGVDPYPFTCFELLLGGWICPLAAEALAATFFATRILMKSLQAA